MSKKEYVLALLYKISEQALPVRKEMITLIEGEILGDSFLDVLIAIFHDAEAKVEDQLTKEQLHKSVEFLHKIKSTEYKDREHDEKDLFDLDQMLDAI